MSGANGNTATATTAIAETDRTESKARRACRGRFAPSPTGRLHLGSLLAAAGSFLEARAARGEWLVRMEDIDTPRVVPGAADDILRTLEALGFEWDGPVVWQSARTALYAAALSKLEGGGHTFACSCSRRELAAGRPAGLSGDEEELFYPGTCRRAPRHPGRPLAIRFRVPARTVSFEDALQGACAEDVSRRIGDFVIRRRDGLFAYQLAVVVDDADQGITHVVRGCDLLDSTPRQLLLHEALELPFPSYSHLPVLVEPDGAKLAKARRSVAVETEAPVLLLHQVLKLLHQAPPADLADGSVADLWAWATTHWNPAPLRGLRSISVGVT